jgi:hypothetical protein
MILVGCFQPFKGVFIPARNFGKVADVAEATIRPALLFEEG